MATPLRLKRMARERQNLEKSNDDYFVHFENDNLLSFHAYVIGPSDTLYAYKFVKLYFEIPERYPLVPPKVRFIQHSGGRLHPNLYVEGKVCLSILGTWPGEKWAFAMTIETVLITIRSLLDNSPYKHEPHGNDNPKFNQYVQYTTWKSLLLDHVNNEQDTVAKEFLQRYISKHGANIIRELQQQTIENPNLRTLTSPYGGQSAAADYNRVLQDVIKLVDQCKTAEADRQANLPSIVEQNDIEAPLMDADGTEPSSMEAAQSQHKLASTSTPSSQPDNTEASSTLKRKHDIIELS